MDSKQKFRDELAAKNTQIGSTVQQISIVLSSISRLSQRFSSDSAKAQQKINKVQFSRPRGNPHKQWPHCPMTERIRAFHQVKDRKERDLWNNKSMLRQVFDHEKAILTSKRAVLETEKHDIQCQIKQIRIRLNLPVNYNS